MRLRERKSGAGVLGDITNNTNNNVDNTAPDLNSKPIRGKRKSGETQTSFSTSAGANDEYKVGATNPKNSSAASKKKRLSSSTSSGPSEQAAEPVERLSRRRSSLRSSSASDNGNKENSSESKQQQAKISKHTHLPETASVNDDNVEQSANNPPAAAAAKQVEQAVHPPQAPGVETQRYERVPQGGGCFAGTSSSSSSVASVAPADFIVTGFSSSLMQLKEGNVVPSGASNHVSRPRAIALQLKNTDPAKCLDRIDDMYDLYYQVEDQYSAKPYMDEQGDINRKMRSILVDWLVDIHNRFKLQPLTLWLTVNILDRYLMRQQTMRSKLQLVGVSAMFIAAKYEEIFPPFLRDCVQITDFAYEREDLLAMEKQILITLNYEIFVPTGFHFLSRYLNCINASESVRNLASYYAERNLQEYDSLHQEPHRVAAAALFAALLQQEDTLGEMSNYTTFWCSALKHETGFHDEMELVPYAKTMVKHVSEEPETASKRKLIACRKKFALPKYMSVSQFPLPNLGIFEK